MKKVNLNFNLKNLDGDEVVPTMNAGKLVAQTFANDLKGDALKLYTWAVELNAGNELSLDGSDFETFRNYIKTTDRLTAIAKGQIIQELNKIA